MDDDHAGSDLDSTPVTISVNSGQLQTASVIQSVTGQMLQVDSHGEASSVLHAVQESDESKKRRDLLNRRPSYRKIFNELSDSSNLTANPIGVTKIEEESDSDSDIDNTQGENSSGSTSISNSVAAAAALQQYTQQNNSQVAGAIQLTANPQGDASGQSGLQTLTMSNIQSPPQSVNNSGATIVQYAQGPDGQFFIPVSTLSAGSISYQLAPASSLGQSVMVAGNNLTNSPSSQGEEASRKRELRLLKNRDAARECRRKKKEYIKCLENRVALLENQNKTLIAELKSLKDLYCQKEAQL